MPIPGLSITDAHILRYSGTERGKIFYRPPPPLQWLDPLIRFNFRILKGVHYLSIGLIQQVGSHIPLHVE